MQRRDDGTLGEGVFDHIGGAVGRLTHVACSIELELIECGPTSGTRIDVFGFGAITNYTNHGY